MATRINRLTAQEAKNITKPGRHADGGNLYLNVTADGRPFMGFPLQVRRQAAGKGPRLRSPTPCLACQGSREGRKARQALAEGRDPLAILEPSKIPTFGEAADEYIEAKQSEWRNAKHAAQWRMTLTKVCCAPSAAPG